MAEGLRYKIMALTDGLKAYYKLDSNANDSLGNYNGTATSMSWSAGKIGQAGSFNGSSSKIAIATTVKATGVSYVFWIYCSNINPSQDGKIVDIRNSSSIQLMSSIENYNVAFYVNDGSSSKITTPVSKNTWTHFVLTSENGSQKIYKNGALATSDTKSFNGTTIGGSGQGMIGQEWNNGAPRYYSGLIDEVGIWDRALSAGEVAELYNGGDGLTYPFTKSNQHLLRRRLLLK